MYEELPELQAELQDWKILALHGCSYGPISTINTKIETAEDFKGLQTRTTVTIAVASYALVEEVLSKFISREATGTLLIPYWPFFIFEFIAFVVLAAALLGDTMKAVAAIFNKEVAEDVMSSWT